MKKTPTTRPLALFALILLAACQPQTIDRTAQNKDLIRRYINEIVNTGTLDSIGDFISPEYVEVYESTQHPIGIEGAKRHVAGIRHAFPDLEVTVEHQVAEGDWVVSQITARGTHLGPWLGMAPTGENLTFTGVNVDKVIDGRIVEHGGSANLFGPLLRAGSIELTMPDDGASVQD